MARIYNYMSTTLGFSKHYTISYHCELSAYSLTISCKEFKSGLKNWLSKL